MTKASLLRKKESDRKVQTLDVVLAMTKAVISEEECPDFSSETVDWDEVFHECKAQSIAPIFQGIVDKLPLPEEIREKWHSCILTLYMRNLAIAREQTVIFDLFASRHIKFVVLKGMSAARYYAKPLYRTSGDIDLLVSEEQFDEASKLLAESGFECAQENENRRHLSFRHKGTSVELHRYFSLELDCNERDVFINTSLWNAIPKSREVSFDVTGRFENDLSLPFRFSTLPDYENGIVLLQHMNQHLPQGLGFRQLIDFIYYIKSYLHDDQWYGTDNEPGFCAAAAKMGLEKLAKTAGRMGQLFFGLSEQITWCSDADDALCVRLLRYMSEVGNFGRKEESSAVIGSMNIGGERLSLCLNTNRRPDYITGKPPENADF